MNYPDKLNTIDDFAESSFKEKGSTFTGQVYHCENEENLSKILSSVRKRYYDATHHCYAYKLLNGNFKYSDDGEPNGTAGVRIFNAIEHFNLMNVIVIVIRYYGGTKLGAGPLGKAYHSAAYNVISDAKRVTKLLYESVTIESGFEYISHVHRVLSSHHAIIAKTEYTDTTKFECLIRPENLEAASKQLIDLSGGAILIHPLKAKYYK